MPTKPQKNFSETFAKETAKNHTHNLQQIHTKSKKEITFSEKTKINLKFKFNFKKKIMEKQIQSPL